MSQPTPKNNETDQEQSAHSVLIDLSTLPKPILPLSHLSGNTYAVIGAFHSAAREVGWPKEAIQQVLDGATKGPEKHLLRRILAAILVHTVPPKAPEMKNLRAQLKKSRTRVETLGAQITEREDRFKKRVEHLEQSFLTENAWLIQEAQQEKARLIILEQVVRDEMEKAA